MPGALQALVDRLQPGVSVRQICSDADIPHSRLASYLKPGTTLERVPPPSVCADIARALGCREALVTQAFLIDIGYDWEPAGLAPHELSFLVKFRKLSLSSQKFLATTMQTVSHMDAAE